MYPRNAASPPRIAVGTVVQISDGAVQTSGCTVRVIEQGGAEGDGGGTTAYSTDGVVLYTPTQAETDQSAFVLIAKKTGCIPVGITIVTTASATAGYAGLDWASITAPTTTVNLSGTTVKTATDVETDTADIQTRLPAALVSGRMSSDVIAISGDTVAADNAESFFDGTGYAGTGNVIPTVTTVSTATNVTTVNGLAANVITAASIATGAIDADALATDAVAEIADGVWDEVLSGHLTAGTTGAKLNDAAAAGSPPSAATIADAVWDEARSGHTTAGTFGQGVASVQGGVTGSISGDVNGSVFGDVEGEVGSVAVAGRAGIADAVWDEARSGHVSVGSFGEGVIINSVAAGAITAAAIANGAVDADALATDAVTEIVTAILTTAMTESYNTDGAAPTLTQALMLIMQILSESSVASTTLTVKKLDGSTTAATFTLSDATTPTSITRAS